MFYFIKLFAFIRVIVLLFGGLYYAKNNTTFFESQSQQVSNIQNEVNATEKDITMHLEVLRSMEFDTDVLRSNVYLSLKENKYTPKVVVSGRKDIFAPLQ